MLAINDQAPEFTLLDSNNNSVSLKDFRGKSNTLLIFYPGDDTKGCAKQLCAVRDNFDDFSKYNTIVLGINHAGAESHNNFIEKYSLKNHLLIDEKRKVVRQYNAFNHFLGIESTKRSVILIDKNGLIKFIKRGNPKHKVILKELKKLEN